MQKSSKTPSPCKAFCSVTEAIALGECDKSGKVYTHRGIIARLNNGEYPGAKHGPSIGGPQWLIPIDKLTKSAQREHAKRLIADSVSKHESVESDGHLSELLATNAGYKTKKAFKYLPIIKIIEAITGRGRKARQKEAIDLFNQQYPDLKTSYSAVCNIIKRRKIEGDSCLIYKFGQNLGASMVQEKPYQIFKLNMLDNNQNKPIVCWKIADAYAEKIGIPEYLRPKVGAYMRKLINEIGESAIEYGRLGPKIWDRRNGFYLKRDLSRLLSGEAWIMDHCQIDNIVLYRDANGHEKLGRAWITVVRDWKSGKWLSYVLHFEPPNQDHILAAIYRAAIKYGIPKYLYLDNGKDFRAASVSGGRRSYRLDIDEPKIVALTAGLGITVIFAWPYNAAAKAIERDFRNNTWLSKNLPCYTGPNTQNRPESLPKDIKSKKYLTIDQFDEQLNKFIEEIVNKSIISSGYRAGKCADEIFESEYPEALKQGAVRRVTKSAMMLFCTRVSSIRKIGRRGFHDGELEIDYYADWMPGQIGRRVYIRRDSKIMQEGWIFDALTNEFIGCAYYLPNVAGIANTNIEREQLKEQIKLKHAAKKLMKALTKPNIYMSHEEKTTLLAAATRALNDRRGYFPKEIEAEAGNVMMTRMDRAVAKNKRLNEEGMQDISDLAISLPGTESGRKPFAWDWEREKFERDEAERAAKQKTA